MHYAVGTFKHKKHLHENNPESGWIYYVIRINAGIVHLFQVFRVHLSHRFKLDAELLKKLKPLKPSNIDGDNWHTRESPCYIVYSTNRLFVKHRIKFKS